MGLLYYQGRGVKKDPEVAAKFFIEAINKKDLETMATFEIIYKAMAVLGEVYFKELDKQAEGVRWYQKAADKNEPFAQFALGKLYLFGDFFKQDIEKADELFKRALKGFKKPENIGEPDALFAIGTMYSHGLGVNIDPKKAFEWYLKADKKGYGANAQYYLAIMHFFGSGVKKDTQKANLLAKNIYPTIIERIEDDSTFLYALSLMRFYGLGTEQDMKKSFEFLEKAAKQKESQSLFELGYYHYFQGLYVKQDIDKGLDYIQKAAALNYPEALFTMGLLYEKGIGFPHDLNKAIHFFTKAARLKNLRAQYKLGMIYLYGQGVPQDKTLSFEWFFKAAENNYSPAMYMLGEFYSGGYIRHDLTKANRWYEKAANSYPPSFGPEIDPSVPLLYNLVIKRKEKTYLDYYQKIGNGLQIKTEDFRRDIENNRMLLKTKY